MQTHTWPLIALPSGTSVEGEGTHYCISRKGDLHGWFAFLTALAQERTQAGAATYRRPT
jgi:hypothetical protein